VSGGAGHRRKGDQIERELVHRHRHLGIHAERYPLSGSSQFRDSGHDLDLYINGPDEAPCVFEVKARGNGAGFTQLERWLGDYDLPVLRRNHADPMIVLPWRVGAAARTGSPMSDIMIDGNALIRAKRISKRRFEKMVSFYRARGATDRDLVQAMTAATQMIDPLGSNMPRHLRRGRGA